jgi:RNA polymerase sigma factor (sigma-70 family)
VRPQRADGVTLTVEQFTAWYQRIRPVLVREARRRCGADEAEDIVQETWLRATTLLTRFDSACGPEAFGRWIVCVLAHVCQERRARLRSERMRMATPEEAAEAIEQAEDAQEPQLDPAGCRDRLLEMIGRIGLTARQEGCFRLWLEGLRVQQIADRFGIRQQVVSEHLAVVRRKLREVRPIETIAPHRNWFREVCAVTIYRPPKSVWDRRGTVEEIQKRRLLQ